MDKPWSPRAAHRRSWRALLPLLVAAGALLTGPHTVAARPPGHERSGTAGPRTAEVRVRITVDGRTLPVPGLMVADEVLAPVPELAAALGGTAVRSAAAGMQLWVQGHPFPVLSQPRALEVDGLLQAAPVEPLPLDARVYVPLRAVAQAVGDRVRWQGTGTTAAVAAPQPIPPVPSVPRQPAATPPAPPPPPRHPVVMPAPAADPATPAAVVPYTPQDLNDMARVVDGEADGQPYLALVGVAAVIVNRVRSGRFPDSLPAVIFAPGQFQAVGGPLYEDGPTQEDISAALAALHGEDPTHGALYFFNPATTWSGSWIFTLPVLATFGAIRFAA